VLPLNAKSAVGSGGSLEDFLKTLQKKSVTDLPVVTFINPVGEIIYFSAGYKIGIGNEILRYLHLEKPHQRRMTILS
jgi:hypothetical protein